jgi:hypothetical protein
MPLNIFSEQLETPQLLIRVPRPGDGAAFNEDMMVFFEKASRALNERLNLQGQLRNTRIYARTAT